MAGQSIDRILLERQVEETLGALEEYAKRIGRTTSPIPTAPREWKARLLFLIGEHRAVVSKLKGAVKDLAEQKRSLNARLNQMSLASQEQD